MHQKQSAARAALPDCRKTRARGRTVHQVHSSELAAQSVFNHPRVCCRFFSSMRDARPFIAPSSARDLGQQLGILEVRSRDHDCRRARLSLSRSSRNRQIQRRRANLHKDSEPTIRPLRQVGSQGGVPGRSDSVGREIWHRQLPAWPRYGSLVGRLVILGGGVKFLVAHHVRRLHLADDLPNVLTA